MEEKKKTPFRMIIDIDKQLHYEFKMHAMKKNITLKAWVIQACIDAVKKQKEYDEPKT